MRFDDSRMILPKNVPQAGNCYQWAFKGQSVPRATNADSNASIIEKWKFSATEPSVSLPYV